MLQAVEISPDVYWVGAIDWNERNFHGYTTERGTTYNAYLIMDEHVTLIDSCKAPFADDLMQRVASVVDPSRIEYLIANHGEMDHSGALPKLHAVAPNAQVICSAPQGEKSLSAFYGDLGFKGVKTGDTLCIGKRTLQFTQVPMVHWPDSMVTYSAYDRILFSNDAFGQHLASSERFDGEAGFHQVMYQAQKYYANIVMPYGRQVRAALDALAGLDIGLIAPAHGVIWRSHVTDILEAYGRWGRSDSREEALVVYDSMWGTTERMAKQICETFVELGIPAKLLDLKANHISDIMAAVLASRYVAVGSPTLNSSMMPAVASFLCYLGGLAPKERVGLAFGSYGWAPLGPKKVDAALREAGFTMPEAPFTHQWTESEEDLAELRSQVAAYIDEQR